MCAACCASSTDQLGTKDEKQLLSRARTHLSTEKAATGERASERASTGGRERERKEVKFLPPAFLAFSLSRSLVCSSLVY